ncbi:MAG TPA: hypothetical protein VK540_22565 [Polyangiaceae bacterium]|nr:hypothetical protein [Polyangiaceae bacterium]
MGQDSVHGDTTLQAPPVVSALVGRWKRPLRYVPVSLTTIALAAYTIRAVIARCGHPAVPLDDAFIHFQYAKRLASGHFFSYVDGEGYSSGATSLLWPILLAPLHAAGLTDLSIIWAAWAFGFLALGALTVETYRLALPLVGRGASAGAAAMVPCFGGYVFGAASGMEVVPLAFVLAFALRRCIEWGELSRPERSSARRRTLIVLAFVAPLLRPEGMLVSVIGAGTLAAFPPRERSALPLDRDPFRYGAAALALAGALVVPLLHWALTGSVSSSTTVVKWLPGNPYYGHGAALLASVRDNLRLFFDVIIDGREWSAVYIPSGARPFALAALVAIPAAGRLRGRSLRAALILLMALSMLIPCTYLTFLWNRLRYLWPFAFAWFIGLACLARCVADAGAIFLPRFRLAAPVLSGIFAGALASHLGWTLDDLASSASAIDRQQVALGRWARTALEPGVLIGVNDTGAISYLSERSTFDIVGLTTPGEARYWVAGAGSRFEHYEQLARASPARLPTHFIVYPHWLGCDAILGEELYRATVLDQTILGGVSMLAYTARYDALGSGESPRSADGAALVDALDVSDLESEAEHRYELGPTRETENLALSYEDGGQEVADGTRVGRSYDRFVLRGRAGSAYRLVARLVAPRAGDLEARIGGELVATIRATPPGWSEAAIDIPANLAGEAMLVSIVDATGAGFGSAHYWLYER